MAYVLEHSTLGFCWWDIPALIIFLAIIIVFIIKRHQMRKTEKELEDQLSEICADKTVKIDDTV